MHSLLRVVGLGFWEHLNYVITLIWRGICRSTEVITLWVGTLWKVVSHIVLVHEIRDRDFIGYI